MCVCIFLMMMQLPDHDSTLTYVTRHILIKIRG